MTRWAFVSDIHGNKRALDAAEHMARDRGADQFVCLGDVIGRGDPAGCVEWVRDHAALAIVGNRDLDYLDRLPPALQSTVRRWGNEVVASDFVASHGEPRLHRALSSSAVKDGFRGARQYMIERGARVWFFGHTHRSRAWRVLEEGADPLGEATLTLDSSALYVVNVGTTGLPLPGRDPASFVIYDDTARLVERVPLRSDAIVPPSPLRRVPAHV